ncbi:trimeric intracellular cation channel family protein [Nocardioides bruguierae]|uniref:trimeric intracellular cation channel family protein n=1 Tax=Nocardioides bruguierae TaxID=2945102 RepID=UPI0027E011D3|nr:trimeric intracellular cation channel family protein [Nocardioides bruguierae]
MSPLTAPLAAPDAPVTGTFLDVGTTLLVLDLLGIVVFAASGGLVGVRKELDLFGVLVLAGVTGLGGGLLRDVLIGVVPPAALVDWRYLLAPAVAGVAVFAFHPTFGRMEKVITVLDAAGLALFCVAGALKAMDYGVGPLPAALMGMTTAVGGGMMRDVLAGRVPVVFRGELYATPALGGAAVAVVGTSGWLPFDPPVVVVSILAALVALVWRLLAVWRNWQAPLPKGPASV